MLLAACDVELELRVGLLRGLELVDQLVRVELGVADLVLLVAPLGDVDRVLLGLDVDRLQRARRLELGEELPEGVLRAVSARRDQLLGEEREHDHDQDRERRALEEPAHGGDVGRRYARPRTGGLRHHGSSPVLSAASTASAAT